MISWQLIRNFSSSSSKLLKELAAAVVSVFPQQKSK